MEGGEHVLQLFRLALILLLFVENGTFNSSSEAEKKAQFYYLSCLNTQKIEELGAQPLTELIAKVTCKSNNVTGSKAFVMIDIGKEMKK